MLSSHGSRVEASPKSPVDAISPQSDSGVGEWKVVKSRRRSSKSNRFVSKSVEALTDENRGPTEKQVESALTSQIFASQISSKWGQESRKIGNTAKLPSKATLALDLSTLHKLENEHVLDILERECALCPSQRVVYALSFSAFLGAFKQSEPERGQRGYFRGKRVGSQ